MSFIQNIKGVIFDIDGVLLDSLEIWTDLGERYLVSIGKAAEEGLADALFSMSMERGAVPGRQQPPVTKEMGKADSKHWSRESAFLLMFTDAADGRSRPQAVCVKCLQMLMRAWHLQTLDSLFIHPIVLISGKLIDGFLVIGFVLFQDSGRKVGIIR